MQKEDRERMDEGRGGWVMFEERCEEMVAVVVSNKKENWPNQPSKLEKPPGNKHIWKGIRASG